MSARLEVTKKFARAYGRASKKERGLILDQVVGVTGWSRDNARRRLRGALKPKPRSNVRTLDGRKTKGRKYSYDALKVLQFVWAISDQMCGPYLAAAMEETLTNLEANGVLVFGIDRYSLQVRAELLGMSPATIDRYLGPKKSLDPIRGYATTRTSPHLRDTLQLMTCLEDTPTLPGYLEIDTVAHCGPTLQGEFAYTLTMTDFATGWVHTTAIRNNARKWVCQALDEAWRQVPFKIVHLDSDNGSEFINHAVISWAAHHHVSLSRSRPRKKNDQAHVESKNHHIVRRQAYHLRYDTSEELALLQELWPLVCDRANYFTPTKKRIGTRQDTTGRTRPVYDKPKTPLNRLIETGQLSKHQIAALRKRQAALNLAELTRHILAIQDQLISLSAGKTLRLQATLHRPLPDPTTGIKPAKPPKTA